MKAYPSVSSEIVKSEQIYAFDKLDGSNMRAEWSRKRGFYKFGTRKRLLGEDEKIFGKVPGLVRDKYSDELEKVFRKNRWDNAVCFFEFYGPNSFCGWHDEAEEHTVTLLDVATKKGLIDPRDFVKMFGHLDSAELLYRGRVNADFIQQVKEGTLPGMTHEGVVCKGKQRSGRPLLFKIKNEDWYKKLRERCGDNDMLFKELA